MGSAGTRWPETEAVADNSEAGRHNSALETEAPGGLATSSSARGKTSEQEGRARTNERPPKAQATGGRGGLRRQQGRATSGESVEGGGGGEDGWACKEDKRRPGRVVLTTEDNRGELDRRPARANLPGRAPPDLNSDPCVETLEDRLLRGHVAPARDALAEGAQDGQRVGVVKQSLERERENGEKTLDVVKTQKR